MLALQTNISQKGTSTFTDKIFHHKWPVHFFSGTHVKLQQRKGSFMIMQTLNLPVQSRNISTLLFCFLFILLYADNSTSEVLDRVVAVVNEDVILLSELEDTGKPYFQKVKENTPEQSRATALQEARNEVLESLIEKSLINQKAKVNKVTVTDEEYKKAYEQMRLRSGLSEEQFVGKLRQTGMSKETYEKNLRYQVLQNKLINFDIRSKIIITDDMVKQYYESHAKEHSVTKGGYALLQMGFTWGQSPDSNKSAPNLYADKMDAKQRAERAHKLAGEGQDFRELAKKYSNLPSAKEGGDIGVFQEDDMAPDMREAIIRLKPGEISNVLETPAGFQFFKLVANKDGADAQSTFETAKEGIRDILYEQQLKKEFDTWVKNLRDQAYIKKM
jgi:peptidyl-prolyl cis-trans isomerase SurA